MFRGTRLGYGSVNVSLVNATHGAHISCLASRTVANCSIPEGLPRGTFAVAAVVPGVGADGSFVPIGADEVPGEPLGSQVSYTRWYMLGDARVEDEVALREWSRKQLLDAGLGLL